jgi:hypothetical protein
MGIVKQAQDDLAQRAQAQRSQPETQPSAVAPGPSAAPAAGAGPVAPPDPAAAPAAVPPTPASPGPAAGAAVPPPGTPEAMRRGLEE